jgi:hypothetical protein
MRIKYKKQLNFYNSFNIYSKIILCLNLYSEKNTTKSIPKNFFELNLKNS